MWVCLYVSEPLLSVQEGEYLSHFVRESPPEQPQPKFDLDTLYGEIFHLNDQVRPILQQISSGTHHMVTAWRVSTSDWSLAQVAADAVLVQADLLLLALDDTASCTVC